jgi:hypothetical protein
MNFFQLPVQHICRKYRFNFINQKICISDFGYGPDTGRPINYRTNLAQWNLRTKYCAVHRHIYHSRPKHKFLQKSRFFNWRNIHMFKPVLRVHDILVWIRIRMRIRMRIRILLFSFLTFKRPTKTNLNKKFSVYNFLKVHLHNFSKMKSQKEENKKVEIKVILIVLLNDRRIRIFNIG